MHVWIYTVHAQYRYKYTFTHTCRIWKQHTHTHTHSHTYMINNSNTQTKSEPNGFPLWEFCKQISRQCDLFPLCLSRLYNKLRNNLCAHAIFSSGSFGRSFKPDECDGCWQHMAVIPEAAVIMGASADNAKIHLLPTHPLPISCLSSPAWVPSTTQGLSLRHHHHHSSPANIVIIRLVFLIFVEAHSQRNGGGKGTITTGV